MQRSQPPLYVLHPAAGLRERLRRLPGRAFHVVPVRDWPALHKAMRQAPPAAVAVVDPRGESGLSPDLRELAQAHPSATLLAALRVEPGTADTLRTLDAWGVADVIDLTREATPAALERRLGLARTRTVRRMLDRAFPRGLPSRSRGLLDVAATVVADGGAAPQLAAALHMSERTVPRLCQRAELPPPRRLLTWLRLLTAADLLDEPTRTVEAVARGAGYASASPLKAALRAFVGAGPTELRRADAFGTVAAAFARELSDLRGQLRSGGKPARAWVS